jgi:hypothetical protein
VSLENVFKQTEHRPDVRECIQRGGTLVIIKHLGHFISFSICTHILPIKMFSASVSGVWAISGQ